MMRRLGSLLVGSGAIALAVIGMPATTVAAGASPPAQTFTLAPSGASTAVVGTTHWIDTGPAGPAASFQTPGPHPITAAGAVPTRAHAPDAPVGTRGTTTLAVVPGSVRGTLGQKHGPTGHLVSVAGTAVGGPTAGLASVGGINAYDQGSLHPVYKTGTPGPLPEVDVEPPDQGLCAGNGMIMEVNNMVAQVFTASTMAPLGGQRGMALEKLFTTPEVFGGTGGGTLNVQGDPRCYYTPSSDRWFASQIWLTELGATPTFSWAGEFVAVSATTTPLGTWSVYFIPDQFNAKGIDHCNNLPLATLTTTTLRGPGPCFGDQPLLGVDGNAIFISVNEYGLYKATGPGGVATEYVLSKTDLLAGNPSPIYWGHLGDTVPRPTTSACPFTPTGTTNTGAHCPYYSIVPANSDGAYLATTGGTFYSLSNVTFTTSGGDQIAVWQFTHTDVVSTGVGHVTGSMTLVTTKPYTEPPYASQKSGPLPLGKNFEAIKNQQALSQGKTIPFAHARPLPEGPIATNTDRVTTAAYDPATGALWAGINTGLATNNSAQSGVFWATATPSGSGSALAASNVDSGYLAAKHADIQFPGIAFTSTGAGLMDYSLSGSSYYPSTAYSLVGANGPAGVHMANVGVGPQDGFSEYTPSYHEPRWGDYSTALATGSTFFFATEKINQSCSPGQFKKTFTCGGTRDVTANWGTSVSRLPG